MKILTSGKALAEMLSPAERAAYFTTGAENCHLVRDDVSLTITGAEPGTVQVSGRLLHGAAHFMIRMESQFPDRQPCLVNLVGNARTGEMLALQTTGTANVDAMRWNQITDSLERLSHARVCQLQKDGFQAFSTGKVTIPEVLYLPFSEVDGDLHLKGAHAHGGGIFVLKVASGFPGNRDLGLPTTQGLMIAFDAASGAPLVVLQDEGRLTDARTAIAGRIAAETLMAANRVKTIGMLGTGVQARLQMRELARLYPACRKLIVWGRTPANAASYASDMECDGWDVEIADSPSSVAATASLIVTTTMSETALLNARNVPDTVGLIIAVGADTPGKIELAPDLLAKADHILIDSIPQGLDHGNAAHAINAGVIQGADLQEFGDFLENGLQGEGGGLRIFLSSGIGVQDLQIVQAVLDGAGK